MGDLFEQIDNVGKGSKTIVEAFKEIGLVKEAFERSNRLETKINQTQQALSELKARQDLLATSSYVEGKTEKLQRMIETLVRNKFDEYTSHLLIEISHKISDLEAKKLLDLKVNWSSFNEFKNTYGGTKLKLDTFIETDFTNYKLKLDSEIKKQQDQISQNKSCLESEMTSIRLKMEEVENKLSQVLNEDELSVKDNQSDIDFEKMIGDIEKKIIEEGPGKVINLKSADVGARTSKVNAKRESENRSPIIGFEPDHIASDYFGRSVSPTYKKPEVLSRKDSIISNRSSGGLKQMTRKVAVIEKEISDIFHEIRIFNRKFEKNERDLKSIQEKLEQLTKRCDSIQEDQKKMENTFIHRLRAKDMQNSLKKNNIIVEKVPGDDLVKLNKELNEKNKKITQLDHNLKYLITEMDYLKHNQSEKFKAFQESLSSFERDKKHQDKEFHTLKTNISIIENGISDGLSRLNDESCSIRPTTSENVRERDFSNVRIRRKSQDIVKMLSEEPKPAEKIIKSRKRGMSATPKIAPQNRALYII